MPSRDSRRQLSKEVLGREHALAIAGVFLGPENFLQIDEVVDRSAVPRTTVFRELELLTRFGALRRFQDQRNLYAHAEHPYWAFVQSLLDLTHEHAFGGQQARTIATAPTGPPNLGSLSEDTSG